MSTPLFLDTDAVALVIDHLVHRWKPFRHMDGWKWSLAFDSGQLSLSSRQGKLLVTDLCFILISYFGKNISATPVTTPHHRLAVVSLLYLSKNARISETNAYLVPAESRISNWQE